MNSSQSAKIPVTCILSAGHSGSTLLGFLLGANSKIFSAGEFHTIFRDYTTTSQGVMPKEDAVWSSVINEWGPHKIEIRQSKLSRFFNLNHFYYRRSTDRVNVTELRDRYFKAFEKLLQETGKEMIVLASTNAEDEALLLAGDQRFELKIIHLTRDGRGVANSYAKKYGYPTKQLFNWWRKQRKIFWTKNISRVPSYALSYEDIARKPNISMSQLCEFLEVDYEDDMLHFRSSDHRLINGNRMRFNDSDSIVEDVSWKDCLPKNTILWYRILLPFHFWLSR